MRTHKIKIEIPILNPPFPYDTLAMRRRGTSNERGEEPPAPPPSLQRSLRDISKAGKKLRLLRSKKAEEPVVQPLVIDLRGLSIRNDGALAIVRAIQKQRVPCAFLDMSMCYITDEGAVAVAALLETSSSLKELRLQSNAIGDDGGAAIAKALLKNVSLTSLRIESNRLGEIACNAFEKALRVNCNAFRELHLNANPVQCAGAQAVARSLSSNRPRVLRLNLQRCEIGDDGACAIASALRTNSTITFVNLQRNVIADEGASAIARSLQLENRTVRILDLRDNLINCHGMESLEKMVNVNRGIRQLFIENNHYAGDEELLNRRLTRVMDLNEIGYWRVVEEEMRLEREKAAQEAEAAAAAEIERELMGRK